MTALTPPPDITTTTGAQRWVVGLLSLVMLLEGFDEALLVLVAPQVKHEFGAGEQDFGVVQAVIQLGLFAALLVTMRADRAGRRTALLMSVAGASIATAATAAAPTLAIFATAQFLARVFLGALYVLAILIVVEVVPAGRRGAALGLLLGTNAIGILLTAVVVGIGAQSSDWSWRWPFLVGIVPLALWPALRKLPETHRPGPGDRSSWRRIWAPPYRAPLIAIGVVTALRALPLFASIAWFAYYASEEAGLSTGMVSIIFLVAFAVGALGYQACGFAMDRYGRRRTATVFLIAAALVGPLSYLWADPVLLTISLTATIFFGMGIEPVLGALTVELFPPALRGAASAWVRNVFQVVGFAAGPALVGWLGDDRAGLLGQIGPAVATTFPVLVLAAVVLHFALPGGRS